MVDKQNKNMLKRLLLQTISQHIIQDVPPELYACEICRKTECLQDEWIACENRIAHMKCLNALQDKTKQNKTTTRVG
jgi:hypothetical protein